MKKLLSFGHPIPLAIIAFFIVSLFSCEKDERKPPKMEFKTTNGYAFTDQALKKDTSIKVGVIVTKVEDDLKTFNVSNAFDNSGSMNTVSNEAISGNEKTGFSRDLNIKTRNQVGTERYVFTVTDVDGNIQNLTLNFNVQ